MITRLTATDMADASSRLAAVPSGTARDRMVIELPAGEFDTDATLLVEGKRFWSIIGGPTTLHYPTYGPVSNDGNAERRHSLFKGMSDFYLGGLKIHGPHTVKQVDDPTKAKYDATKAFQHGFSIGQSQRVTVEDVEAYEIAGDGMYLNAVDDIQVLGLRVEFNGRQGFAGIDGNRWLFDNVTVVNSARNAFDFEPIGNRPGTTEYRWVSSVTIRNSDLRGGTVMHRVSMLTLEGCKFHEGAIIVNGTSVLASQRRYGVRILNNQWPELVKSNAKDAAPIQVNSVNGIEIRGNKCHRDPTWAHTANAPFVEMKALPVTGHLIVKGNDLANWAAPFRWKITAPVCVTTDIG